MGRPKKTAKVEKVEKSKNKTEEVSEEKSETSKPAEDVTDVSAPAIRILLRDNCPKLSARGVGDLEFEVGIDDETDEAYVRISGNASSGAYSTKWVKLNDVRIILDNVEEEPFKANVLAPLYAGQSNSNVGYIGAILKALGVLDGVDRPPSALKIGSWDQLMNKITKLNEKGISLKDEIAIAESEKVKKKQAAAGKKKSVKQKTSSKS